MKKITETRISFNPPAANNRKLYDLMELAAELGATVTAVPTKPIFTIVIAREDDPRLPPLESDIVRVFKAHCLAFPPLIKVEVVNDRLVNAIIMRFEDGRYNEVPESEREEHVRSIWQCNT